MKLSTPISSILAVAHKRQLGSTPFFGSKRCAHWKWNKVFLRYTVIDNKGKVKGQEPRVNIVHAHPHCVGGLKSYNHKAHKKPKTDSLLKTN